MNTRKSINLVEIVSDEVALEGLDGITLEALWQRLAIRLGETLPLKDAFMEQIWQICLELHYFTFYKLEIPRDNLLIFDRYELEYLNIDSDKEYEYKDIYVHDPIEDTKFGIRGSCSTYTTRQNISNLIKSFTLSEINDKYGQKLVVVASQSLRESVLIDHNVSSTIQLHLAHYCYLERIGRARTIGEITIKKSSTIKEDAKALFYIRKGLQDHGLIRKQVYYQASCGANYNGQNTGTLVHLTRFFNTRKPKVIMWAEHLINYLKSKENYAAEYNEVKNELNLDYSIKKFFKINLLQKVFRTDVKVPYRSYYPNSLDKEWQVKSNANKERIIKLVTLSDPNIEINDLWRSEEVKEDDDNFQLDIKSQKLNVPFLKQIYSTVESKEFKGASQSELGAELGFTKLISRTLVRNLVKTKVVSTYLDDIGRQRTTKFVSRKFDGKSSVKKQMEVEISKIKEYSRAMQNENVKVNLSIDTEAIQVKNTENDIVNAEKPNESENEKDILSKTKVENANSKDKMFMKANNIFRKYKLFKNQNRYRYTSSEKNNKTSKLVDVEKNVMNDNKEITKQEELSNEKENSDNREGNIIDSDLYKTIESELIVQKPECKKKSQKMAVVGFMENVHNSDNNKQSNISYRLLRRANLVIESVKQHKIIEDLQKLIKYINSEEDKEGIDSKIDKNSLMRLLQKLAEDNFIKYIKLVLKTKKNIKIISFICDPSIDENDSVILSAVEKAKLKFCMLETNSQIMLNENTENTSTLNSTASNPNTNIVGEEKFTITSISRNNELGKKYGYSPKFIRMKTMHIFLYHLIYDHPGHHVSKSVFLANMKSEGYLSDVADINISNVYTPDISWKMFIPPLPKHRGYPSGWGLMCDILLRMPLSVFVKVYNANYEVPGLLELLEHPVKRHMLVKDASTSMLNLLFAKRKYMFSIHEIVLRLCYLGLVQFGPQVLKEKDQIFVYLNRRSELLDTTSSAAGYHRVEDKPYPLTKYHFTSIALVESYWYEMWNTCINTCLGGRSVVEGKDILLEDLSRKLEMIQATKMRVPEEAARRDTGFVPGDRKGAAGIDSAFFAHLKRNWNWVNTTQKDAEKKENRPARKLKPARTTPKLNAAQARRSFPPKKRCTPLKQSQAKASSTEGAGNKSTDSAATKAPAKLKRDKGQLFPVVAHSKPPKVIRKVLPRKPMRKRVKYDEIDFSALQRMDKLRVDWEQHEDNILLVCKVAMVYLCPNPRRNLVSFTAIRDILRSYSFTSYNKTSRACQRRLLYMLKQPKTVNSVLLGVEEVKQDYFVNKRFGGQVDSVRGESEDPVAYEQRVEKIFKDLVTYIAKKYYNISNMEQREPVALPKTIQEFNIFHKLKLPTKTIVSPGVSKEVREVNDIHTSTINSVIHSSMCCGKERRSWAYQLFKVYQQYPEYLLRSAMLKIRADQMVTMKKNYMCAYKKFGNCMPMSSSQYQLSSAYYYKFQTKWPYEVFSESYSVLHRLLESYAEGATDGVDMKPGLGGIVAAMHDFIGTDNLYVDIEIPDQIIMLDPGLPEKDEVYQRIALRYQTILEGLSSANAANLTDSAGTVCQSNNLVEQADSNSTEPVNVIEEQENFVQIRSAKRTLEHDYCSPQKVKKLKLDNEEYQTVVEINGERNESDIGNNGEEIQSIIQSIYKNEQSVMNNDHEKRLSLVKSNLNFESFLCEPMDNDNFSDQYKSVIENANLIIDPCTLEGLEYNYCNEEIVTAGEIIDVNEQPILSESLVKNDSMSIQTLSYKEMESDSGNNNGQTLVNNTSMNMQSFSCEPIVIDCTNYKRDDISVTTQNFSSESVCKDNGKSDKELMPPSSENQEPTNSATSSSGSGASSSRVSDLVKRAGQLPDAIEGPGTRPVDIGNDVRTRQTRIAMLKMREELHDLTFHDSHHAHEYFVVNSFKLLYSLLATEEEQRSLATYRGMELPRRLLPMDVRVANAVLEDVKRFAVFPKSPVCYDDFKRETLEAKLYDWDDINGICKFVRAKAEFGATLHELATNFGYLDNKLADILSLLSDKRIVLRAGIITVRYIHYRYVNPWIIHSYKILRLEKESHQTIPEGTVYVLDNEDSNYDKDNQTKRVTTAANLFYNTSITSTTTEDLKKDASPENKSSQNSMVEKEIDEAIDHKDKEGEIHNEVLNESKNLDENNSQEHQVESADDTDEGLTNQKRLRRNRTVLLKQKDIYRAAKLLDFNTAEEIKVVIKPWIRIDGVVNRRVLDRMLGAVLCYCIEKPGISLTLVQNRFTPAIQPYHTRELIEILVKLDCVKMTVQKVTKVTLFSKPAKLDLTGNPDLVADSDRIIIEPTVQATLRFGMFLSNRSYSLDFLSSL